MAEVNFTSKNQSSAKALVIKENAPIKFIKNPKKPGSIFFVCGSKRGYVSPAVCEKIDTISLDEMQYAEVSKDGGEYIPCLMVVGNHKPMRTLGEGLLHK